MSRKHYINIPNIIEFNFGKQNYSKFLQVAVANGATKASASRDRLTGNIVLTFFATREQAVAIENALNALG